MSLRPNHLPGLLATVLLSACFEASGPRGETQIAETSEPRGEVEISANLAGADIHVNDRKRAITSPQGSVTHLRLPEDRYDITVSKITAGWCYAGKKTVLVRVDTPVRLDFNLQKALAYPPVKTLEGHQGSVDSVAFSPDGQNALSGSKDGNLILWNIASGEAIRTLHGHGSPVYSVAFKPTGQAALSGNEYGNLILWNLGSGKAIPTFRRHAGCINSIAISPDGKTALSGSNDGTLKLWDIAGGQRSKSSKHDASVRAAASAIGELRISINVARAGIYVNGEKRAVTSPNNSTAHLRLLEGEYRINVSEITAGGHQAREKTVFVGADTSAGLYFTLQKPYGAPLKTFSEHRDGVLSLAISPDRKTTFTASSIQYGPIKLRDLENGKVIRTLP